MPKLLYITNTSLDGFIEDQTGAFDWADPAGTFAVILNMLRSVGTHLYGRRLYETMAYWESPAFHDDLGEDEQREFAQIWQSARKIVFSRTLASSHTRNTRIEREFDPHAVATLKRELAGDIIIGGAELASQALRAGLVDECHLFVHPVIAGAGKRAFAGIIRQSLELLALRHLPGGVTHLQYRVTASR